MPNKNYFAQLSPKQKAELFLIYTSNGMYNLDEITNHYNSEMDRAYSSTEKDMVARMRDVNAPYLLDEEGNKMTHMMASGDGYVFPTIQRNDNGDLEDYGNTEDWGAQRAIDIGDTLQFKLPTLADYFSKNYKTHLDNPIMHGDGGNLYGIGSWLKGLFNKSDDASNQSKEQTYGEYLPIEYKEYYSTYKNYDDWKLRHKEDANGAYADLMARYYYNNDIDSNALEFFKLRSGPYQDYINKRNQYELAPKYSINFNTENSYRLKSLDKNGKPTNKHTLRIVPELLDYIYDEAVSGGTDPKSAIAVAVNESNLGNARAKNGKINLFNLFSYWAGTGSVVYPNSKVVEPYNNLLRKLKNGESITNEDVKIIQDLNKRYTHMANTIHEYKGDNVVADATKYFLAGKYAGGSKEANDKYHKLVMSRFDELMNDQRFRTWWENKSKKK